jgi:hypothetical protein
VTSPSGCDGGAGRPLPGGRTGRRRFPLQRLAGRDKDAAAPGRKTGVVAGSAAACGWKIGGYVSGEYESEDGVYVLAYTDSTATSVLSCPKGTSDFMFNRAQVVLNGHPKGTAKTSECTRAWCTVAVSTAIWHCTHLDATGRHHCAPAPSCLFFLGMHRAGAPAQR